MRGALDSRPLVDVTATETEDAAPVASAHNVKFRNPAVAVVAVVGIVGASAAAAFGAGWQRPKLGKTVALQTASVTTVTGKGCSNWDEIRLGEVLTVSDADACFSKCDANPSCTIANFQAEGNDQCHPPGNGVGPGACYLYQWSCRVEDNPCWTLVYKEIVDLPASAPATKRSGCHDWKSILLKQSVENSSAACREQCAGNPLCTLFNFQNHAACGSPSGLTPGTCYLYNATNGTCAEEENDCWSLGRVGPTSQPAPAADSMEKVVPIPQTAYVLECPAGDAGDATSLTVVRSMGGLIAAFRLNDAPLLLEEPSLESGMQGSTFWPAPQSAWGWPPPPTISGGAEFDGATGRGASGGGTYDVQLDEAQKLISMRSQPDDGLGVYVTKNISCDQARQAVVIRYTFVAESGTISKLAGWEKTNLPEGSKIFWKAGQADTMLREDDMDPEKMQTTELRADGDMYTFDHSSEDVHPGGTKIVANTTSPYIGAMVGSTLFLKVFEPVPEGKVAPNEGDVAVFARPSFVSMENQGPYTEVTESKPLTYAVCWYARQLPEGFQDADLNDMVGSLVAQGCGDSEAAAEVPSEQQGFQPSGESMEKVLPIPQTAYVLECPAGDDGEATSLTVVRNMGGLIAGFRLNDAPLLLEEPSLESGMQGSTFWPAPQSAWGWPPPPTISGGAEFDGDEGRGASGGGIYDVQLDEAQKLISMRSQPDDVLGVSVTKNISCDQERQAVVIRYTFVAEIGTISKLAGWEKTNLPEGSKIFWKAGQADTMLRQDDMDPKKMQTTELKADGDVFTFDHSTENVHTGGTKIVANTTSAYIGAVVGSTLFLKVFEPVPEGKVAPDEGDVAVFARPSFVSMENQGPYTEVTEGKPLTYAVCWYARTLPGGVPDAGMYDMVNSLVAKGCP